MNDLDKMRQMAGIDVLDEAMGSRTHQMALKIIQMAEANAYDEGAESGSVTTDAVMDEAQAILKDIANVVLQKLQADFDQSQQNQSAEIEQQMGADQNMERGETNFKMG